MLDLTSFAPCDLNKKESSHSSNKNCKINYQRDGQRKYVKCKKQVRPSNSITHAHSNTSAPTRSDKQHDNINS
jgi:hypothetical protein